MKNVLKIKNIIIFLLCWPIFAVDYNFPEHKDTGEIGLPAAIRIAVAEGDLQMMAAMLNIAILIDSDSLRQWDMRPNGHKNGPPYLSIMKELDKIEDDYIFE